MGALPGSRTVEGFAELIIHAAGRGSSSERMGFFPPAQYLIHLGRLETPVWPDGRELYTWSTSDITMRIGVAANWRKKEYCRDTVGDLICPSKQGGYDVEVHIRIPDRTLVALGGI